MDNGPGFQTTFHWHVEDLGICHAYIKPSAPQLKAKVEPPHRSGDQAFHQLLSDKGDVDLEAKLRDRVRVDDLVRPHGAHQGKTPYEVLREKP